MMSVAEYASDVNMKIEDIFNLCKKFDIKVSNKDDMLSDDDIILLDNEIANFGNEEEVVIEEDNIDTDFDDSYEEDPREINKVNVVKKKKKIANDDGKLTEKESELTKLKNETEGSGIPGGKK